MAPPYVETPSRRPSGCDSALSGDSTFSVLVTDGQACSSQSVASSSPFVQGRALGAKPTHRQRSQSNAVSIVTGIIDTSLALTTAIIGMLLLAGPETIAPAAYGALLLMAGTMRVAIAVDRWWSSRSARKKEALRLSSSRPATPVIVESSSPSPKLVSQSTQCASDTAVEEKEAAAPTKAVQAAATEEELALKENKLAAREAEIATLKDAAARRDAEHESSLSSAQRQVAEKSAETASISCRLSKAQAECKDISHRLKEAMHQLGRHHDEELKLRKASRLHATRSFRLATKLACAQRFRIREIVDRKQQEVVATAVAPQLAVAATQTEATDESEITHECLADAHAVTSRSVPDAAHVAASESPPAELDAAAKQADAFVTVATAPSADIEDAIAVSLTASTMTAEDKQTTSNKAKLSKKELIAALAQKAASDPNLRDSIRNRLHASVGDAAAEQQASDGAEEMYAQADDSDRPLAANASDSSTSVSDARSGILGKINELTRANERLRMELRDRAASAATAPQEYTLEIECLKAKLQEAKTEHAQEMKKFKAQNDSLRVQVSEVAAELHASQQTAAARDVFQSGCTGPKLSLHWADAWDGPGGAAPCHGADKLRRNIAGNDAKLSIGPPPVDWRTWLQLGLRRGQPSEPALLRLSVPTAEEQTYTGLIWAASAGC